ncbi:MAG: PAS domain S-box protein [Deltaproteobacteria bacterium]|nr:PAS domain S-box protein [Deltaproteobacteria bacterium]
MDKKKSQLRDGAHFGELFYSSRDAMNIYDENGHIVNSNPRASDMLGYSHDELVRLSGPDIIHPKYHAIFEQFLHDVSNKGEFCAEAIDVRKDGSALNIEVWGTRILYDGKPRSLSVVRDITKMKALENQLAEELKEKQRLIEKLIQSHDLNARQISRELHDTIGQTLTSIKMDVENILAKLDLAEFPLEKNLISIGNKTVKAIRDLKDINVLLHPLEFDDLDLIGSIRDFLSAIQKSHKIQVQFFTRGMTHQLDHEKTFALYRIVQEAFTNILKHAHATRVFVHLYEKKDYVALTIEDDGVGFEIKKLEADTLRDKRLGIHIMRNRAIEHSGYFSIDSSKGNGTVVVVEIPFV